VNGGGRVGGWVGGWSGGPINIKNGRRWFQNHSGGY
jgi:hypothetical protein